MTLPLTLRGFLTRADGVTYEYDANGNITKLGSATFTYDTAIKDRIKTIGGYTATYSAANPLNIESVGVLRFAYEGRRLTRFT